MKIAKPLDDKASNPQRGPLGQALKRVDGPAKVTGTAPYAADFATPGMLYAAVVSSAIAKGRIESLDADAVRRIPGVIEVYSHLNRPRLAWFDRSWKDQDSPSGSPLRPFADAKIVHSHQPVALVVAETFEIARYAGSMLQVSYAVESSETELRSHAVRAREPGTGKDGFEPPPKPRGDAAKALAAAPFKVTVAYSTPTEHHNAMELFATTVFRSADGKLTVHDKTQGITNSHDFVHKVFGIANDDLTLLSPFVGGGFGSGLRPQYQLFMAVLAATGLKRSVQVVMTREQMFSFGHRPPTLHRLSLGAETDGRLTAVIHECDYETSRFEDYVEVVVNWSALLYRCANVRVAYKTVPLDVYTPLDMRAPGAAQGVFALEGAMDELAYAAGVDPVELRRRNHADHDQTTGKPWSSNELLACLEQGAARFGWATRPMAPRSLREGRVLIGQGMACGVWDAMQQQASAKATFTADGRLRVASGTSDIGTGTYTVMTQIAAATLGLPIESVDFRLGDSSLPTAPLQGGSFTVSSVGSAVKGVCDDLAHQLLRLTRGQSAVRGTALSRAGLEEVEFADGTIRLRHNPKIAIALTAVMQDAGKQEIEAAFSSVPDKLKQRKVTMHTHSAVFVEVAVDEDFGKVQVRRVVSAIAAGRIMSAKMAHSQILGGVVWGLGMALQEDTLADHRLGRYMNHSLAEYHIPVNADIPAAIDVIFVEERDAYVNALGAKGVGEIGIVGVAAAVANAVFHATGRRVRDLPITLDKVLAPR